MPLFVYPASRGDSLCSVVREGDAAPGGSGYLTSPGIPTLNNAGDIAFTAKTHTTAGIDEDAILVGIPNAPPALAIGGLLLMRRRS